MSQKVCTKCKQQKNLTDYRRRYDRPSSYHSWCRQCEINSQIKYGKNEKQKTYHQQWYQENKKRVIQQQLEYQKNHPEVKQKYANSEKGKATSRASDFRRRQRLKNLDHTVKISRKIIQEIIYENENKYTVLTCEYCKKEITIYHIDHKISISQGGTNSKENLCVACPSCNLRKGVKSYEDFIKIQGETL